MNTKRFSASATPNHCGVEAARRHCGVVTARHHCGAEDRSDVIDRADVLIRMSDLVAAARHGSGHHCAPRHA